MFICFHNSVITHVCLSKQIIDTDVISEGIDAWVFAYVHEPRLVYIHVMYPCGFIFDK